MMKNKAPATCAAIMIALSTLGAGAQAAVEESSKGVTPPASEENPSTPGVELQAAATQDVDQQVSLLQQIAVINASEIRLGTLILERARTKEARNYGKALILDHLQVLDILRGVMEQKGSKFTDEMLGQVAQTLREQIQTEFASIESTPNSQLISVLVNQSKLREQKVALVLKGMQEQRNEPEFRKLAAILLHTVRKHMSMAEALN